MGDSIRVLAWPADANRTGNPYNSRLAKGLRAAGAMVDEFTPGRLLTGKYDVFHAHWPDGALGTDGTLREIAGAAATLALTAAAKARGTRVVWTVHNLHAHRTITPWVERAFWRGWTGLVDGSIHLAQSARSQALAAFPSLARKPSFVVPHPHYRDDYQPAPTAAEARQALGIPVDAKVAGFVGHIRPYKNVPALLTAFLAIEDSDACLLVAGRPESTALEAELRAIAGADPRIRLVLETVPDERVPGVLAAIDLVVLPYGDVLNSGAAILALSFDRPVLVPRRGAMSDLLELVGPEWVKLFAEPLTSSALADALTESVGKGAGGPSLDGLDPAHVALATLDAYRQVLAGGR